VTTIASNLDRLYERVRSSAEKCGRDPDEIRVLAVSKTFSSSEIIEAYCWGQRLFGENRVQEAQKKIAELKGKTIEWHLIGHLQSNKARLAAQIFDVVQSIDSTRLAIRLDRICQDLGRKLRVYIQLNLAGESQKSGIDPQELPELVDSLDTTEALKLEGLMTIPPYDENPENTRPYFRRLREILEEINRGRQQPLTELSMGMSHDFEVAIEEGATMIRVGTAIFGQRAG